MRVIDPNRDLHNRDKKLEYWMKRIKEDKYLDKKSRNDLLRFIDFIGNEDQVGALRKVRYISILLLVRKNLTRSFRNANKQDINKVRKKLEGTNFETADNIETFRAILKRFYKWLLGRNKVYPQQVEDIPRKVKKEITDKENEVDSFLTKEEIARVVPNATSLQRRALIGFATDTGGRPEEVLRTLIKNIQFDERGAIVFLGIGKTYQRRIRMVAYAPLLRQWMESHPLKSNPNYSLFVSEATNYKNQPLGMSGFVKGSALVRLCEIVMNPQESLCLLMLSVCIHIRPSMRELRLRGSNQTVQVQSQTKPKENNEKEEKAESKVEKDRD